MKFRKKPVEIEARQFTTNNDGDNRNMNELVVWINSSPPPDSYPRPVNANSAHHNGTDIFINTLEGEHRATVGDWIIKGVKGEFYPCKPDIFEATYDRV